MSLPPESKPFLTRSQRGGKSHSQDCNRQFDIKGIRIENLACTVLRFPPASQNGMFRQIAPAGIVTKVSVAPAASQHVSAQLYLVQDGRKVGSADLTESSEHAISPAACLS